MPPPSIPTPQAFKPVTTIPPTQVKVNRSSPLGGIRSGRVCKGEWRNDVVAVKVLPPDTPRDVLCQRLAIWEYLSHPNVHSFLGVVLANASGEHSLVVTKHHTNGNIRQYLTKNPRANRAKLVLDVALGMQFIHQSEIVHGSLRPSNILIKEDGSACVTDCGLVYVYDSKSTEAYGYYSPEAWKGKLTKPSDVYAFAMSVLEIFTSKRPWGSLPEKHVYHNVVLENIRPDPPIGNLPSDVWDIIEEAWGKDPRLRPTFEYIVTFWMSKVIQAPLSPPISAPHRQQTYPPTSSPANHTNGIRRSDTSATTSSIGPPAYNVLSSDSPDAQYVELPPSIATPPHTTPMTASSATLYDPNAGVRMEFNNQGGSNGRPGVNGKMPRRPRTAESSTNRFASSPIPSSPLSAVKGKAILVARASSSPAHIQEFGHRLRHVQSGASLGITEEPPDEGDSVSPLASDLANVSIKPGASYLLTPAASPDNNKLANRRPRPLDLMSITSGQSGSSSGKSQCLSGTLPSPALLVGALHTEIKEERNQRVIDEQLAQIHKRSRESSKEAERLITAGAIPALIYLLRTRAADNDGLEIVLLTLGYLSHDSISANTIFRTETLSTMVELYKTSISPEIMTLTAWCLNRICRSAQIATELFKHNLVKYLLMKGLTSDYSTPAISAYLLGTIAQSDALADAICELGAVPLLVGFLQECSQRPNPKVDELYSALYAIARLSRSIRIAKMIAREGCVPILAHHLLHSNDPLLLDWCCRTVGCLMRPNSGDMSRILLDEGIPKGLARVPNVLSIDDVHPLASFAFAIQRFSAAEWGSGTRKSLVDAGVVDSLLAALRTASEQPYPQVHVELVLAVSFLGDVGGSSIRKEIIQAGGIKILQGVAARGGPEVSKACNMAIKSITGNIFSRNAAAAKTAMSHNWNGGCPDYQPDCPLALTDEDGFMDSMI